MPNPYYYNPKLKKFASENRKAMSKAEACLWKYALRKSQMLGYGFKRQRPLSNYIVDFVCLSLKLIIEVDGYSHQVPDIEEKDLKRQVDLENLGFTVLRFQDSEILQNINMVREVISEWILNHRESR